MSDATRINNALLRADLWRLLAGAFTCPTDENLQELSALAAELADCLASDATSLALPVQLCAQTLAEHQASALEGEYHSLFTTQVLVSPYEGTYHRTERGAIIGDVAAFYTAFALQLAPQSGPPDALWNELAFLAWLALKEAYALEQDLSEALEVTQHATRRFLDDHLGRWVPLFVRRLLDTTGHPVYVTAAQLLIEAVALTAEQLGIEDFRYLQGMAALPETDTVLCPVAGAPEEH
ncbi:MAG: molecular chaperone [Candidatus Tectimicrobiota bacterium]